MNTQVTAKSPEQAFNSGEKRRTHMRRVGLPIGLAVANLRAVREVVARHFRPQWTHEESMPWAS